MKQQNLTSSQPHTKAQDFNLNICKPAIYFTGSCGAIHTKGDSCSTCCTVDQEMHTNLIDETTRFEEDTYAYNLYHMENCDYDDDNDDYENDYYNNGDTFESDVKSVNSESNLEVKRNTFVLDLLRDLKMQLSKLHTFIGRLKRVLGLRKAPIQNRTSASL